MKKARLVVSAFAVLAVVGSAFAFKPVVKGQGSVYCNNQCTTRVNYRVATSTTSFTDPCDNGTGGEYVLAPTCTQVNQSQTVFFEQVAQ